MSAALVLASESAGGKGGLLRAISPEEAQAATLAPVQVFTSGGGGFESCPVWVYVQNGRIIRTRPMRQPPSEVFNTWSITARSGTVYAPTIREGKPRISQKMLTLGRRVYDPHRLKYPMQRVDWSPTNRNPQTRGNGQFVRITWAQAFSTIASELNRAATLYGPSSIEETYYSHTHPGQQAFTLHEPYRSIINRVLCATYGGYTPEMHSPDSWEGWVYGGSTVWGYSWSNGLAPKSVIEDALQNSQLIIQWAHDPLGQTADANYAIFQPWFKAEGIRRICITPDFNATAAAWADNWVPVYAGTDASLAAAIAYVWITEGTYQKSYISTHVVGFNASTMPTGAPANSSFSDYILGTGYDKVPKTPEWAEPICGVKARTIRAIAHEWASKPTMVSLGTGSANCRSPYGHEWPRYLAILLGMQGLGMPGRSYFDTTGEPSNPSASWTLATGGTTSEVWGNFTFVANNMYLNNVQQFVWKSAWPWAINNPPIDWYGGGYSASVLPPAGVTPWFPHRSYVTPNEYCFTGAEDTGTGIPSSSSYPWTGNAAHYHYPMKGYSNVHVVWAAGSQKFGCWMGQQQRIAAWQNPSLDFVFRVDYWMGGEIPFSDIILPACTFLERVDILDTTDGNQVGAMMLQQCIPPMYQSMSDFQIEDQLATALGVNAKVHEGLDEMGWIQKYFNKLAVSQMMTFTQFQNMTGTYPEGTLPKYYRFPWNPLNVPLTNPLTPSPGMRAFANSPAANALDTKSGMLEFYSQYLAEWFPDDKTQRPPVPQAGPSWESLQSPLAQTYPLLVESPHPRFRLHTQFEENLWLSEIPQNKIWINGYPYEALWINSVDAAARGINFGDLVRVFNARGQILCAAYVTERVKPGVIRSPDGGHYDPINPGNPNSLDKGGAMNMLTPMQYQSTYASSFSVSSYLAQVEKYTGTQPVPPSVDEQLIAGGF